MVHAQKTIWRAALGLLLAAVALLGLFQPATAQESVYWKAAPTPTPDEAEIALPGIERLADPRLSADPPALPPGALLPDLQTLPVTELRLTVDPAAGLRTLRFTNRIANAGPGPLELRGQRGVDPEAFIVEQRITADGQITSVPLEGSYYYNRDHTHYHWEGFAAYEIWTVETGGSLSRRVLANDKVGYCLTDTHRVTGGWLSEHAAGEIIVPPSRMYGACNFNRQGISPGWVDVYRYTRSGQSLDVSDLPDGVYALRTIADPRGVLHETDRSNNDILHFFALEGNEVIDIGAEFSLVDFFALMVDLGKVEIAEGKVILAE